MNARPTPGTNPIHMQSAHSTPAIRPMFVLGIAVAALLVGGAIGYFVPPLFTRAPEPAEEMVEAKTPEKRPARNRQQSDLEAELKHLRKMNREKDRQIADMKSQLEKQSKVPVSVEPLSEPSTNRMDRFRPFGRPPSAAEMRAHFEEMREKDPERYAQITNNMARWRAHRQERLQTQFDILASADTTHMTKDQRKVHETYQDLLLRQEELREMMSPNNADITDEQREAAFREMRDIGHQLHDLQRTERDTLLTQTANSLGLRGQQAQEVVSAIKAVYEATSGGHHGPHGGGPGGPRGGGRGRR